MAKFPLTVQGKNLAFIEKLSDLFDIDHNGKPKAIRDYKKAFTARAVRDIHEEIVRLWPKTMDIGKTLSSASADVSGLYVGDYSPEHLLRSIVRHSLYSSKLLIADPFVYAHSVRNQYNPILNPDQYRTQTLRNVNLWLTLAPWIKAGLVEIIRTPADFSHKLQWDSLKEQEQKFASSPELQAAAEITVNELRARHVEKWKYRDTVLSMPDFALVHELQQLADPANGITVEDLLDHVRRQREDDPDFLEVASLNANEAQITMLTTGGTYNVAKLTASMTGSYLVTDLTSKWKEIELDRAAQSDETEAWSPFAKAFQDADFKYLNDVSIEDALRLRREDRLGTMRTFLRSVWKQACDPNSFGNVDGVLLADELNAEVAKANVEWSKIDQDLLKTTIGGTGAGLMAAGPLIESGHGYFLAGAAMLGGAASLVAAAWNRRKFPLQYPAAFFLKLD
jgi:hypothetical protein